MKNLFPCTPLKIKAFLVTFFLSLLFTSMGNAIVLPWSKNGDLTPPKVTCYVKCHINDHGKSKGIYKTAECTHCHGTAEEHKEELKYALIALNEAQEDQSKLYRGKMVKDQKEALIRLKGRPMKKVKTMVVPPDGMVYVPPGEFIMGSNNRWDDEGPEYVVYMHGYFIDKYEITNKEYKKFVDATGHKTPSHWEYNGTYEKGTDDIPVVYIGWADAYTYAKWAGKRLPTEEEWEKAARGTDGRQYPWGNEFSPDHCNEPQRLSEGPMKVGSFPSGVSPYGAHDMVGNVWEWVNAWYLPHPGNMEKSDLYGETYRLAKGGSWYNCLYYNCGISAPMYNRAYFLPTTKNSSMGFRCVKDVK